MARNQQTPANGPQQAGLYLSPRELARRWACSRSTVDRIAARERLTRLCLGVGRNGIVRYLRQEVEALERERLFAKNRGQLWRGYSGAFTSLLALSYYLSTVSHQIKKTESRGRMRAATELKHVPIQGLSQALQEA